MAEQSFSVGDSVLLRSCRVGQPGRVIRFERGKAIVHWTDIDFIGKHRQESLLVVAGEIPSDLTAKAAALRAELECGDENARLDALIDLTDLIYGKVE
jgi:hypothetical protein